MPGTRPMPFALRPALAALLCLALLPGCYARRSIASDPPPSRAEAPVLAAPAPATPEPAKPAQQPPAPPRDAAEAPAAQQAPPQLTEEAKPAAPARQYYVQVGAFGTTLNALGAVSWLKGKGFEDSRMVRAETGQSVLFKVQAGPFQDLAAAGKALETLRPDWPQAFIPGD